MAPTISPRKRSVRKSPSRRPSRNAGPAKATRRWSAQVTTHSDALDLRLGVFQLKEANIHCCIAQTLRRTQDAAQGEPVPLRPVDAHLLHQSRRQKPARREAQDLGASKGRARELLGKDDT